MKNCKHKGKIAERQFWYDTKKKKMKSNTLICCLKCGSSFTILEPNTHCQCTEEETTGSTQFDCCNICGKIIS